MIYATLIALAVALLALFALPLIACVRISRACDRAIEAMEQEIT